MIRELTDAEQQYLDDDNPAVHSKLVPTGLTSDEGATHLEVHRWEGNTLVVPIGEENNGGPWAYDGTDRTDLVILQEYLDALH